MQILLAWIVGHVVIFEILTIVDAASVSFVAQKGLSLAVAGVLEIDSVEAERPIWLIGSGISSSM